LKLSPDNTIIEVKKLRDYLLNPAHPEGATKARYLSEIGYNQENFQVLEDDLRDQHLTCNVIPGKTSIYGVKYEIIAPIVGPNGQKRLIRSIWMIRKGDTIARLITLIPEKEL
jgi:filamentous hemagglutinin